MKTISILTVVAALVLCGCNASMHKKGFGLEFGFGIKPPTNAIVGVKYTKIGIIVSQNPTTQTPEMTLGYQRGEYYRIPLLDSNQVAPAFQSGIITTQDGFKTTIREEVNVGVTNQILQP